NNTLTFITLNDTTDNYTVDTFPNGEHNMNVTCWDWANNSNTSFTLNFSVYTRVPTIEVNWPLNNTNSSNDDVLFNWTAVDYSNNRSLKCNLTLDSVVNKSNLNVTNNRSYTVAINNLDYGSHEWNLTCWDYFNHTNRTLSFNYSRGEGPYVYIITPENATLNVSNLRQTVEIQATELGRIMYNLDGEGNFTLCTWCSQGKVNLTMLSFGQHKLRAYIVDYSGNLNQTYRDFWLQLDTDANGTIDAHDNDSDADNIWDVNDTLIGNTTNIATNIWNLSMMVNGSLNLSKNYTGVLQINITNASYDVIVSLQHNFTNLSRLVLANVSVEVEDKNDQFGKVVVRNLEPFNGTNKTVYVNVLNSTHGWVCVKDSNPGLNTTLTPTCQGSGEIRVRCNGTATGKYHCEKENGKLRVWGLSYSVVQAMCEENWSVGSWSSCSDSTQTRTVTDSNGCGTELEKPATSQSCTSSSNESSSSSTSSAGSTSNVDEKVSMIVGEVKAGDVKLVELNAEAIGVESVELKLKEDANGVKIVLSKLSSLPANLTSPEGKVYRYLEFDNQNLPDEKIEQAKIKFKVERSWMNSNGFNSEDIVLSRYSNNAWQDLETKSTKLEQDVVYFEAITTGFSYFVIKGKAVENVQTQTTNDTQQKEENKTKSVAPPATKTNVPIQQKSSLNPLLIIGGVAALVVLGVVIFLVVKKFTKKDEEEEVEEEKVEPEKPMLQTETKPMLDESLKNEEAKTENTQEVIKENETVKDEVAKPEINVQEVKEETPPQSPNVPVKAQVVTSPLINYVKQMRQMGFADETIRERLKSKNWHPDVIEEALKS
ncbi:PGF-pre-PGF domain-containing protein, partial [Candidatus Woesearchaeota archaeon]